MNAYLLNINYPNSSFIKENIKSIGVDDIVVEHFLEKFTQYTIKIIGLKTPWANILKQEALSLGTDLAVSKDTYRCKNDLTDALLTINKYQYKKIIEKLTKQYFMKELKILLENLFKQNNIFSFKNKSYDLKTPLIVGILNLTPDSFSDGGKYNEYETAIKRVAQLINDGADIIDIGGESTRPGAKKISIDEELKRVLPIIRKIKKNFDIPISLDTNKLEVAKELIKEQISILNDTSGGKITKLLEKDLHDANIATIIMQNKSQTLTGNAEFQDLTNPLLDYILFAQKELESLKYLKKENILFDPGIGFSWSKNDTKKLLESGFYYSSLPFNTILGISRKSFFQKHLDISLEDRDIATITLSAKLIREGVKIFRTHDVKALNIAKRVALYY